MKQFYYHVYLIFSISFSFLAPNKIKGQQASSQYAQYMYSANIFNPAYPGSNGFSLATQYRTQWTGIAGAPKSLNITVNQSLEDWRIHLGASIISNKVGPSNDQAFAVDFSYDIDIGRYSRLALGIKAGTNLLNVDFTELNIYNSSDPQFQNNIENRISPIAGIGLYSYSDLWYTGISIPNLLSTSYYQDKAISVAKRRPVIYLIGGYLFYLNPDVKFKPTFLIKGTPRIPISADISANFLLREKLTLGASYRLGNTISGLASFQLMTNLLIGVSYDLTTSNLVNYNGGSYEVFLRFDVQTGRRFKYLKPRFF